jgi:hypothetical protein
VSGVIQGLRFLPLGSPSIPQGLLMVCIQRKVNEHGGALLKSFDVKMAQLLPAGS